MAKRNARQLWADKVAGKQVAPSGMLRTSISRKAYRGTILGVDPSLRGTGLAIVEFGRGPKPVLLHSETLKMKSTLSIATCLGGICARVLELLESYEISDVALEQTIYVQNVQTAQVLGAARGAAIAAAAMRGYEISEYPPLRVKQAVVGHGRASKEQVAKTVRSLLGHGGTLAFDESDASAIAFTHAFTAASSTA